MPMLIEHIDAIARKKQRDVLLIKFYPDESNHESEDNEESDTSWLSYNFEEDLRRVKVLAWLEKNKIPFQPCGEVANECSFCSYLGDIYVDVPYDEENHQYRLLRDYLENPDGTMRDENVRFCYLPLERAMKNAYHDEPGFWEKFWGFDDSN